MSESSRKSIQVSAPGRINLIGEHIDYNGGHVLPAAIDRTIHLNFTKNNTSHCNIYSEDFKESFTIHLNRLKPSGVGWQNYILGVMHHINILKPNSVEGFDCEIKSDLPVGSGISSSAALECGMAKGLNLLFDIGLTDEEIILLARDAEHSFVGTKCGIMDQFAVVKGKEGHFILLNCQNLEYSLLRAELQPYSLLLLNTNVSHNLSTSAYNTRRDECERALDTVRNKYPQYEYLADVPQEVIEEFKTQLLPEAFKRALYVVQENRRVLLAAEALQKGQLKLVGEYLYASHQGLKDMYEVSCKELDYLVEQARQNEYVLGARMMGGGFGGCTINLVHQAQIDTYIAAVSKAYYQQFSINLTPIRVNLGNGVYQNKE